MSGCALQTEPCTAEETAAINWLKRNLEPEEELRKNWRLCSRPRLKELLVNKVFTPVKYIETWNDVLKLPTMAYKLVGINILSLLFLFSFITNCNISNIFTNIITFSDF